MMISGQYEPSNPIYLLPNLFSEVTVEEIEVDKLSIASFAKARSSAVVELIEVF
jgi:hypothetical protein